jgi:hypothetical protein
MDNGAIRRRFLLIDQYLAPTTRDRKAKSALFPGKAKRLTGKPLRVKAAL